MGTVAKLFRSSYGYVSPYFIVDVDGNLVTNTITLTGKKIELNSGSYIGYAGDVVLSPTKLGPSVTTIEGTLTGLSVAGTVDIVGNLNLSSGTFSLNPGTTASLNNTAIGLTTPVAGKFTSLTSAGTGTISLGPTGNVTINPTGTVTINPSSTLTLGTAGQSTTFAGNISATASNQTINLSPTGTGSITINPNTIGAIDNIIIGATTPRTATFTNATISAENSQWNISRTNAATKKYVEDAYIMGWFVGVSAR